MRAFLPIWFGQLVSTLGSDLTGFALGVWVFELTGSATQFSLALLATTLPRVLLSPVAGVVADRWDRRKLIVLGDLGAGIGTLVIYLLFTQGVLQLWHIYLATGVSAAFGTFQGPALGASVTMLVKDEQLGRANGLQQLSQALSQLLAPLLGGWLVVLAGLQAVLLIDMASFLVAVVPLLFIPIPTPKDTNTEGEGTWRAISSAVRYLREQRGLLTLMLYFGLFNLTGAMALALITPLILSFTGPDTLGVLLSMGGLGLLTGSLIMTAWRGPKRLVNGVFGFMFMFCPFMALIGLKPLVWLVGVGIFGAYFMLPFTNGYTAVIFQRNVVPHMQGRVFALTQFIGGAAMPLGYLTAGPLADAFEPLLLPNGPLAASLGRVVGVGAGRGIGLMFVIIAAFTLVVTAVFYSRPTLRNLEV